MQEMQLPLLGWEDPLEKEMATHSNILTWEIPRTDEPGGGSKRVGHDLVAEHDHNPTKTVDSPWPVRSCWPAALAGPTLSLLFVLHKLTPFCNALCLEILFQPTFRQPQYGSDDHLMGMHMLQAV